MADPVQPDEAMIEALSPALLDALSRAKGHLVVLPVAPDESMLLTAHRHAIKADGCANCATGHVPTRAEDSHWYHGTMGGRCLSEVVHEYEYRNGLPAA